MAKRVTIIDGEIRLENLQPLLLLQHGTTLVKVGNVYDDHFTAQVLLDDGRPTDRTTVRRYTAAQLGVFREPTAQILDRFAKLTGGRAEQQ